MKVQVRYAVINYRYIGKNCVRWRSEKSEGTGKTDTEAMLNLLSQHSQKVSKYKGICYPYFIYIQDALIEQQNKSIAITTQGDNLKEYPCFEFLGGNECA